MKEEIQEEERSVEGNKNTWLMSLLFMKIVNKKVQNINIL